jgi:glycosyltransferase involved in cell wall biosynthesis
VESLAAGTPCVVTPVGGLAEIVDPLSPQLVTASADAGDIGALLVDALTGAVPLPTAAQCTAYARRNFDWPVVAARVRDVYELARR